MWQRKRVSENEREKKAAAEKKWQGATKTIKKYKTPYTLRMHKGIDGKCLQALIYTFSLMLLHTKRQNAISKKRTSPQPAKYFSRQATACVYSLFISLSGGGVLFA